VLYKHTGNASASRVGLVVQQDKVFFQKDIILKILIYFISPKLADNKDLEDKRKNEGTTWYWTVDNVNELWAIPGRLQSRTAA
jgi:hypothetical protein